jgi:hypothetical protein
MRVVNRSRRFAVGPMFGKGWFFLDGRSQKLRKSEPRDGPQARWWCALVLILTREAPGLCDDPGQRAHCRKDGLRGVCQGRVWTGVPWFELMVGARTFDLFLESVCGWGGRVCGRKKSKFTVAQLEPAGTWPQLGEGLLEGKGRPSRGTRHREGRKWGVWSYRKYSPSRRFSQDYS